MSFTFTSGKRSCCGRCDHAAEPLWRHQMEKFSALLAICAGNSPVPGEFPAQRPVTRSIAVFFDLLLNKRLCKNHEAGDLRRYRAHNDVIAMTLFRQHVGCLITRLFTSPRPLLTVFTWVWVPHTGVRLDNNPVRIRDGYIRVPVHHFRRRILRDRQPLQKPLIVIHHCEIGHYIRFRWSSTWGPVTHECHILEIVYYFFICSIFTSVRVKRQGPGNHLDGVIHVSVYIVVLKQESIHSKITIHLFNIVGATFLLEHP